MLRVVFQESPVKYEPQSISRELKWTKSRDRFDPITPEEFFFSVFWADFHEVNIHSCVLFFCFFYSGTKVTSDAVREQHQFGSVCCSFKVFFFSLIWVNLFSFVQNTFFLSNERDIHLLRCKLENSFNECLSQVWREINGLCQWFQFRFAFFSSFILFWLFHFKHKPLNFISFRWKFCLVCFFYLPFLDLVWSFVLLFFQRKTCSADKRSQVKQKQLLNIWERLKLTICGPMLVEIR